MFSRTTTTGSTSGYSAELERLRAALDAAETVVIGAGAGLSTAAERYSDFIRSRKNSRVLYLELGVGYNTPVIIKYPFWQLTAANPKAVYACVNLGEAGCPQEIAAQSILIDGDIARVLDELKS